MMWLHPRAWPLGLGLVLLWLLSRLPLRGAQACGRGLGYLAWRLIPRRRRIVRRNLELCFPELDESARRRLAIDSFAASGMGMVEGALAWWGSDARLAPLARYEGLEHIERARAEGRGVLIIGGHFSALEISGRLMAMKIPVDLVYKPARNKRFERVMRTMRQRYVHSLIQSTQLKGLVRRLREGGVCWYAYDQDFGRANSVFAPFFGVPTATLALTGRIAQASGARVVFIYPERLPEGRGFVMRLLPTPELPSGDPERDAAIYNGLIERFARQSPADYFWMHRRFKTRPGGEASPYV
ncbi:MAG: lysophospholipid acyltransferase family protein [Pseudomonadota bacterium]